MPIISSTYHERKKRYWYYCMVSQCGRVSDITTLLILSYSRLRHRWCLDCLLLHPSLLFTKIISKILFFSNLPKSDSSALLLITDQLSFPSPSYASWCIIPLQSEGSNKPGLFLMVFPGEKNCSGVTLIGLLEDFKNIWIMKTSNPTLKYKKVSNLLLK